MELLEYLFDTRVISVTFGIIIPYLIYRYSIRNHNYWKERGIPYATPYPFVGSFLENLRKNFDVVELDRYKKYGRLFGIFEGSTPVLNVAEPELIRDILLKDFQYFTGRRVFDTADEMLGKMMSTLQGEDWKRVRSIVSPTFSTGKLKRVMSIFQDCSRTLLQNFKLTSEKGRPVEVSDVYGAFAMDIILSSAFSTKIDSHNDPDNKFVKMAKMVFNRRIGLIFIIFLAIPGLLKKLNVSILSTESMTFFKSATLEIIKERKKTGQTRNDFLQLLMDTAKEVENEEKCEDKSEDIIGNYGDDITNHPVFKNASSNKHLSMDELIAQCITFFLAGYHTTASTLSFTTYLLALNQDCQEKLYTEISDVLKESNGKLTYEAMQKMKYLDNVISESLRIYTPALRLERTADMDYKLGNTGLTIPKGMLVGIPIYALHRDPILFPDPEKFDPDRFSPQEKEKIIPYSYLPFGSGPRNCVGMRFALLEIKVCLIHVCSAFHVKRCPETQVPLEFGKGQGLLAPKSIMVRMEPRSECPLKE